MRIPPPDRSSLSPDVQALLELATTPAGDTAETIAVLAHIPALVGPFLGWAAALHIDGVLPKRMHEIVALRVAHNCRSVYEWDEHLGWAREAGLDDAEIAAVRAGPGGWGEPEATVIRAADELHANQVVSDDTLAALHDQLGASALVEIIAVVGQYTMLSMLATTTGPASRRWSEADE